MHFGQAKLVADMRAKRIGLGQFGSDKGGYLLTACFATGVRAARGIQAYLTA